MNSKFYVSLEAARMLKEKGYKRDVNHYYDENGFLHYLEYDENYDYVQMSNNDLDLDHYAAPTKAEAIDWLESKGIMISPHPVTILHEDGTTAIYWGCHINQKDGAWYTVNDLLTRLEAEDAAIIKACEFLENGN